MRKNHACTIDNLHHNALTGTTNTGDLLRLQPHNNHGAALPRSTIPVRCVPGHRPSLFYVASLYSGRAWADNQEQGLLRQCAQGLAITAWVSADPVSIPWSSVPAGRGRVYRIFPASNVPAAKN